ncbi:hypothetical protein, partial [Caballeronia catudaia]|uniref:hypothetical protein n=1 Tax=Caballeronia catudaia TaxID=1777136 RepID=UPI000ABE4563
MSGAGQLEANRYLIKLHEGAAKLGWRCVSEVWAGSSARYLFECAKGHRFERGANAFYGRPHCMECEAEEIRSRCMTNIEAHGGTLLGVFTGLRDRRRVRCAQGHEWAPTGASLCLGHWCMRCKAEADGRRALRSDGLERLHAVAAAKGVRCLADEYTGSRHLYPFECDCDHRWTARGDAVLSETLSCSRCQNMRVAANLEPNPYLARLHDHATKLGWRCLSQEWAGSNARYLFECAKGHRFERGITFLYRRSHCMECEAEDIRSRCYTNIAAHGGTLLLSFTKSMTTDSRLERYTIIALMRDE